MEEKKLQASIEAILFAMGEAVPQEKLAQALEKTVDEIREILKQMQEEYRTRQTSGLSLIELDGSWQLCTKAEQYEALIRISRQPKKQVLSNVALETLSIIAYKQPVTKLEIEQIRGVKSDHAVNRLVEYDLVKELGRLDAPGRPILFGTTENFLRHFGLTSLEDLPTVNPVQVDDFREEAQKEVETRMKI